ncbi:MAG TPA: response regulator [Chthoniobacterales bacterium]|jgi:DNA-binding response OmpR family regulator
MKLLVVDDQSPVGEIISRIAQQSGWQAIHTVSPDRLDEIIREEKVDVLLLDFAVNGAPSSRLNGLTIAAQLRAQGLDTVIVLFTGWPDLVDRTEATRLKVLRVLEKPLGIQELRQALNEAKRIVQKGSPAEGN